MNRPVEAPDKCSALLDIARREFPTFYGRGTFREQKTMDVMVVLTSLVVSLSVRRTESPPTVDELESGEVAYRSLGELIDGVRRSPTFALIPLVERMKIESALFDRAARSRQT